MRDSQGKFLPGTTPRNKEDLTGQVFGSLTALEYVGGSKWLCMCSCGNRKEVNAYSLKSGNSKSCGCQRSKHLIKDLTGLIFARLTVIKYSHHTGDKLTWECLCECGSLTYVTSSDLSRGITKSCGCLRSDVSKSSIKLVPKQKGELNYNWKGGITPLKKAIRELDLYKAWRSDVFSRDQYKCQICNMSGLLNAHHIVGFASILEQHSIYSIDSAVDCSILWDIGNGLTLCKDCHTLVHSSTFATVC